MENIITLMGEINTFDKSKTSFKYLFNRIKTVFHDIKVLKNKGNLPKSYSQLKDKYRNYLENYKNFKNKSYAQFFKEFFSFNI